MADSLCNPVTSCSTCRPDDASCCGCLHIPWEYHYQNMRNFSMTTFNGPVSSRRYARIARVVVVGCLFAEMSAASVCSCRRSVVTAGLVSVRLNCAAVRSILQNPSPPLPPLRAPPTGTPAAQLRASLWVLQIYRGRHDARVNPMAFAISLSPNLPHAAPPATFGVKLSRNP